MILQMLLRYILVVTWTIISWLYHSKQTSVNKELSFSQCIMDNLLSRMKDLGISQKQVHILVIELASGECHAGQVTKLNYLLMHLLHEAMVRATQIMDIRRLHNAWDVQNAQLSGHI